MDGQEEYCNEREKEEQAIVAELQIAKQEIKEAGAMSQGTKQRILALDPHCQKIWSQVETLAQKRIQEMCATKKSPKLTQQDLTMIREAYTVTGLIALFGNLSQERWTRVREIAVGRHAIPNDNALDRILRYETTIERFLTRSIEQLERLQRRRRGEVLPPSVNLHLS